MGLSSSHDRSRVVLLCLRFLARRTSEFPAFVTMAGSLRQSAAIPVAPKLIKTGETWDETMNAVDAYFGADPQCGAKTLEEYERQTREFREQQKKLDRAIAHLRIDEEWEEAKRLERKCRELAEPVRPGFHRLDAFTGDPVERAFDFGTVYSRERLLLEVAFENWPLVNSAQVAGR
ncbi:hypothetical protein [Thioclava sp. F34-6]|uniref:hypothetical protein n=1 Tax=Thioclava sp. F34-6 TaxID=1973003 RepID=UPI0011BA83D3|nr:hypothetical protein [Thioclava sp. F34-6]